MTHGHIFGECLFGLEWLQGKALEAEEWDCGEELGLGVREFVASLHRQALLIAPLGKPPPRPPKLSDLCDQGLTAQEGLNLAVAFVHDLAAWLQPLCNQPAIPPASERPEWEFAPGRFRYRTEKWHNLSAQNIRLLQAFVAAKGHTLTHSQINKACNDGYVADRHYAYVSELNKVLRRYWNGSNNPIRAIHRQKAYQLRLPD